MTKYLSIAILITGFLVGNAYGDDLIADLHFDDGSVLHNIKIQNNVVHFKHDGDNYDLGYQDLKSINFDVQPGTADVTGCAYPELERSASLNLSDYKQCGTIGKAAVVTLKIKTKIGTEAIDRFSTGDNRGCSGLAHKHDVRVISKLTGKKITRTYEITNIQARSFLGIFSDVMFNEYRRGSEPKCIFHKGNKKGIKSIVFKDGNKKIEEIKK